jgi:hypothetical protein
MMTNPNDTPVFDTLAAMTVASLENSNLNGHELMLARIAALAAMNAPAVSYLANIDSATRAEVRLEDVKGVLCAIAPIIGTARTIAAAAKINKALGFMIMVVEEELEAEGKF